MKSLGKESVLIFHQMWGGIGFLSPFLFFSVTPFGAIFNLSKITNLKFSKFYKDIYIRWHCLMALQLLRLWIVVTRKCALQAQILGLAVWRTQGLTALAFITGKTICALFVHKFSFSTTINLLLKCNYLII
jgi:hypothetical protein